MIIIIRLDVLGQKFMSIYAVESTCFDYFGSIKMITKTKPITFTSMFNDEIKENVNLFSLVMQIIRKMRFSTLIGYIN